MAHSAGAGHTFAVEGLTCSGKTTLAMGLAAQGFIIIPEVGDAFPEADVHKQFTVDAARSRAKNHWFLMRELERMQLTAQQKPAVLDRSMVSLVAFNYAKDFLYNTAETAGLYDAVWELGILDMVLAPVAYLRINSTQTIHERMVQRDQDRQQPGVSTSLEVHTIPFLKALQDYYERILARVPQSIYAIDATQSPSWIVAEVCSWANSLQPDDSRLRIQQLFI